MKRDRNYWLFMGLFTFSLFLRLLLALVNRQANDDHIQVVDLLLKVHRLPIMFECHECFHPKLFYAVAASLFQTFQINSLGPQTLFMQLINFFCGIAILVLLWKFIQAYSNKNDRQKLLAFALVAFNPKLVGINSQASNDTFVILFSSFALYFTFGFFKKPGYKLLGLVILFNLLAVSTKFTGWITFLAIFLSFLLIAWVQKSKKSFGYAFLLLGSVLFLTTLNPLSQFITNYQNFGSPIANNEEVQPFPPFTSQQPNNEKYNFRPGITSISDGFMTFKFINLIQYPLINNEQDGYPPQRTSFWTMLYADSNSLHFQNWPPFWETKNEENFNISRGIFLLALLPAFTLITGFLIELFNCPKNFHNHNQPENRALVLLTCGGYLSFLILATLLYRDFAFIKSIYILPGLLAFTWIFLRGAEKLINNRLAVCALIVLLGFYVADITSMIYQLYKVVVV